jgi:hypothetical protein
MLGRVRWAVLALVAPGLLGVIGEFMRGPLLDPRVDPSGFAPSASSGGFGAGGWFVLISQRHLAGCKHMAYGCLTSIKMISRSAAVHIKDPGIKMRWLRIISSISRTKNNSNVLLKQM